MRRNSSVFAGKERVLIRAAFVLATLLGGCVSDETLTRYAPADTVFELVSLDGISFRETATLDISKPGWIRGRAPCNTYTASQTAPYPWFEIGPIATTKRACPAQVSETNFFEALGQMTIAEFGNGLLILTNTDGREMVFQSPPKREISSSSL